MRMSKDEVKDNIQYQAEMKGDWAIAYALLQVAEAIKQLTIVVRHRNDH